MTNIRLVYDPFEGRTHIYNEQEEITAAENKICTFLRANGFYECLRPFRKRYVIWEGLLPELIGEVNDEELRIVFEGRESDYRLVAEAFCQDGPVIENAGYEVKWELSHVGNFEAGNIAKKLAQLAKELREMCESRQELWELDSFLSGMEEDKLDRSCQALQGILARHVDKWARSGNDYRQEKIMYLNILESSLEEAKNRLGKL